jgi:uncharacterized protein (DUF1330 family)
MAAYVIVDGRVTDPERYRVYQALAEQALAEAGGHFLARGGLTDVLEGTWDPERLVVIEFPDAPTARAWYEGAGYQAAIAARTGAAELKMVVVEGVPASPGNPSGGG